MSTDLHAALRDAVGDAPLDESDLRTVIDAGSRRVRRRAALRVGSSALVVVAAVVASVVVGSDRSDPEPRPAHVVHLDLGRAQNQDLDVLASVRTTWRNGNDLDHDRFEGLTTDGLVLRSRYTYDGNVHESGLLNPETGRTHWLPPSPVAAETAAVELTADRLVLFANVNPARSALLVFDRRSETWQSSTVRPPDGVEVHVPFQLAIAPDGRLYLGSTLEGESGPLRWWSYAFPEGGVARPEPALAGAALAWGDGVEARADSNGRVVLSTSSTERVVAEERPAGCQLPTAPDRADIPVNVGLAGHRPVVTYWCGDKLRAMTLVYDVGGGDAVQVAGAGVRAADEDHVLLVSADGEPRGIYLLDLDRRVLARIGSGIHEAQVGLAEGLVLWNQAGPLDDRAVSDSVWKVARVPLDH